MLRWQGEMQQQFKSRSSVYTDKNTATMHLVISVFLKWNCGFAHTANPHISLIVGWQEFQPRCTTVDWQCFPSLMLYYKPFMPLTGWTHNTLGCHWFFYLISKLTSNWKIIDNSYCQRCQFSKIILQNWSEMADAATESHILYPQHLVKEVIHQVLEQVLTHVIIYNCSP